MRQPLLVVFGAFFVLGCVATFIWTSTYERNKNSLGWTDTGRQFNKKRGLQLVLCVAAAVGVFLLVIYGMGLPAGSGRTNELGLILSLISIIWFVFRRDIATYQYQTAMVMARRGRPEPDEEQKQKRAMQALGTAFSVLLFMTGMLLLTLNLVFS